jgi:hypothetical protein
MRDGRWMVSCDAVGFDTDGRLVNGQHRLSAVIASETPAALLVVRGLSPDVFEVLDTGKKRSASDALAILGYENYTVLASAGRLFTNYLKFGRLSGSIVTTAAENEEVVETVQAFPHLQDSARLLVRYKNDLIGIASASVLTFVHAIYAQTHRAEADEFMEKLATGHGIGDGEPVGVLRNQLIRAALTGNTKLDRDALLALVVRALNMTIADRRVRQIRYSPSQQDFPQPDLDALPSA